MSKNYKIDKNNYNITQEEYTRKKEVLTSFFSDNSYVLMTQKQIASVLNISKNEIGILQDILEDLQVDGIVYLDESKRLVPTVSRNIYKCEYEKKSIKYGFARNVNGEDVYISNEFSMGAMDGDIVLVKVFPNKEEGKNKEAHVVKILKRNIKKVVGKFTKNRNFGFVVPIDNKIEDIYIPKKYISSAKDNMMVKVEILKYASQNSKAEGKIVEVIGSLEDENIEVEALKSVYGLETMTEFSKLVEDEIISIPTTVSREEFANRRDMTKEKIVTIDGDDAKDLDDAVSVKKLNDGNYLLSVYIADVSHYVKSGTELDKEAISRGTSIYIPGTVIPMLPKKLSNGICSLNEGVDRLALAIDMKIDSLGNVLESDVYKAVINVKKRMTYDKVYKVLNLEDMDVLRDYSNFEEELFLMKELALILNKKRMEHGAINFDIPESKIILNEHGQVIDVKPYNITIANKIIEEFMLIANMTIAEKFYYLSAPFIYRIHEKPDEEKLRELNEVLSRYGKNIKGIKNIHPRTLADILNNIENEEEKQVVSNYMLRALKLAKYNEECLGHFGLSAKYYCHFTSPIRRYPDLFIHRVISKYIESGYVLNEKDEIKLKEQAKKYAKTSSDMEKEATQIEREFDSLYMSMYMSSHIGEEFEGIVSSVTSFGMFVKLENTVEGLVPFEFMPNNDYYVYDEQRRILIGEKTKMIFKIGDRVKVKVIRSDIKLKQIDFKIIELRKECENCGKES